MWFHCVNCVNALQISNNAQKLQMYTFSQNHTGYYKNYWTNTRLVCTHLNSSFHAEPKYGVKTEFQKFLKSIQFFDLSSVWRGLKLIYK